MGLEQFDYCIPQSVDERLRICEILSSYGVPVDINFDGINDLFLYCGLFGHQQLTVQGCSGSISELDISTPYTRLGFIRKALDNPNWAWDDYNLDMIKTEEKKSYSGSIIHHFIY